MSAKNTLQELCQKHGWKHPSYTSVCKGPPHCPIWSTEICMFPPNTPTIKFEGENQPTKKLAEQDAATKALPLFCTQPQEAILKITQKTILMVDVENLPKFIAQLPPYQGHLEIWGFVGKHHHLAGHNYGDDVVMVQSPSIRADGTDTCMQLYVGMFLGENQYDTYLIATRDHFGGALVDLITSKEMPWKSRSAHLVSSVDHLTELFGEN